MPRTERRHRHAAPVLALAICLPRLLGASGPPPLQLADTGGPIPLFLELVVNGRSSGEVVEVTQRGRHYEVDASVLRRLHVLRAAAASNRVAVDSLPGVATEYDTLNQRLLLTVPPEWLPEQSLGGGQRRPRIEAVSGTGLLLNYDFYSTSSRGVTLSSLWSEQRYFSPDGIFSNTGIARRGTGGWSGAGYLRYDTRWSRPDTDGATERSFGDVVAGALPWSSAVRMGGVQWSRNFGLRPDLVTYPLPQFAGQAAVPSAVDLFVNGYRTASRNIDPGPFTFNELPFVSGAGAATVVTTDALGRQVSTSVPFYVSTTLLLPGLTDYSVSLGALRRNYGLRSFDYGQPLAAGVVRRGWNEHLTLEAQGQAGRGLAVAGLGAVLQPGTFGTLSASLTRGSTPASGSGWQASGGYQYNTQRGGISFTQINRQAGYGDASTYANDGYRLYRQQRQVAATLSVGDGALTAGVIDLRGGGGGAFTAGTPRNRVVYASYTRPVGDAAYMAITAGRTVETGETQVRLQLTYTLGRSASANVAAVRSGDDQRVLGNYQQNIPSDGGFGWNISRTLGEGRSDYSQGTLQFRNRQVLVQGGVYGSNGELSRWAGANGSIGWMDGRAFATNRVTDAFALVSTGRADVPVRFDQQLIGRTDRDGYLLVPQVPGYLQGQYAVEMLDLPMDVQVSVPQRAVAVRGGTGALIDLPVRTVESATVFLLDAAGAPLRAGTPFRHVEAGLDSVVGWDGVVYLPQLLPLNTLLLRPAAGACHVRFADSRYRQGERTLRCLPGEPAP